MTRQMRPRLPNRNELALLLASALAIASAALSFHFWSRRGICIDSVVCATISALSLIGLIVLATRMAAARRARAMSESPIYLVMVSGSQKKSPGKKEIRGKMPDQPDH